MKSLLLPLQNSILILILIVSSQTKAQAQAQDLNYTYTGPTQCATDATVIGYNDILTLNEDMIFHAYEAFSSDINVQQEEYYYRLCPQTTYNMESSDLSKTIMPLLNNTNIRCGNHGKASDKCIMVGGQIHVIFGQGLLIDNVEFEGLTFMNNYGVSIGAWAYPTSKAEFKDCHWIGNIATTLVEMYYNPNERRRQRQLQESSLSLLSSLYDDYSSLLSSNYNDPRYNLLMDITQYNEMITIDSDHNDNDRTDNDHNDNDRTDNDHTNNNLRKLQGYPSMSLEFKKCKFTSNTLEQAVILDGGGDLILSDSKFENNEVGVFVIGALYGSQLYIQDGTSFINNTSPLFTVYVDSNSVLEVNEDGTYGIDSYSPGCSNGVFLENDNSYCLYQGGTCHGNCCAFGNTTCDNLLTDAEQQQITVNEGITMVGPNNANVAVGEVTDAMIAGASAETVNGAGCTGACVGLAVALPILVAVIAALGFFYYKKKRDNDSIPNLGNPVETPIS